MDVEIKENLNQLILDFDGLFQRVANIYLSYQDKKRLEFPPVTHGRMKEDLMKCWQILLEIAAINHQSDEIFTFNEEQLNREASYSYRDHVLVFHYHLYSLSYNFENPDSPSYLTTCWMVQVEFLKLALNCFEFNLIEEVAHA